MSYPMRIVDVFTDRPLAGNQLAVVLAADGLQDPVMQAVAREMNFSETTFVMKPEHPASAARVRIFTPVLELPFAGHPTIGTAWVLWHEGLVKNGEGFTLEEGVGPITVRVERRPDGPLVWMSHPPVTFGEVFGDRPRVAKALGLSEEDLVPDVPVQVVSTGVPFLYVHIKDTRRIDAAAPNPEGLRLGLGAMEEVPFFIFALTGGNRLYSRMFAPHTFQVFEDPATGSASGPLGAFAVRYGLVPRAETVSIISEQGTAMGRQSFIHIALTYAPEGLIPTRIDVGGGVVPVLKGELTIGQNPV